MDTYLFRTALYMDVPKATCKLGVFKISELNTYTDYTHNSINIGFPTTFYACRVHKVLYNSGIRLSKEYKSELKQSFPNLKDKDIIVFNGLHYEVHDFNSDEEALLWFELDYKERWKDFLYE